MENYILEQTAAQVQGDLNLVDDIAEAFSDSKVYVEGDIVLHNGKLYSCVYSSTKDDSGWVAAHWQDASFSSVKRWVSKRLAELAKIAEYDPASAYVKGTKACYNGYVYSARVNIPAGSASREFDPSEWSRESIFTAGKGVRINENNQIDAIGLECLDEVPTGPNTSGAVRIVVLDQEPDNKYDGYIYLIK